MVTEFSLDEDFFCSELLNDIAIPAIHDQVLENWRRYGVLVCKDAKIEVIMDAIKQLPPKFHQRWIDALEHYSVSTCTDDWDNFCEYKDFKTLSQLSKIFKTALSEESVLQSILSSNSGISYCQNTGFEVVSPSNINESKNFTISKKESTSDIIENMPVEEIWSRKFKVIARHSKVIDIIDRYLFERLLYSVSSNSKSSIQNFIDLLSVENRQYKIRIISDGDILDSEKMESLVNHFEIKLSKNPNFKKCVSSLTLISNDSQFFKKASHERFIRFDNHVCNIGVGMQIFEKFPTPTTTFTLSHIEDTNHKMRLRESNKHKLWSRTISP